MAHPIQINLAHLDKYLQDWVPRYIAKRLQIPQTDLEEPREKQRLRRLARWSKYRATKRGRLCLSMAFQLRGRKK